MAPEYPFYTPYQFAGNKPIAAVDIDGLEELSTKELNGEGVYSIGALIIQDGIEYQFQGDGNWVKVYSGESRGGILHSTKNLWKNMSGSYNRKTGYTYTAEELEMRYHFLSTDNPIGKAIEIAERRGEPEPISRVQGEDYYGGSNNLQLVAWSRTASSMFEALPAQNIKTPSTTPKSVNARGLGRYNYGKYGGKFSNHSNRIREDLGIPDDWVSKPSNKDGGVRFVDPNNSGNHIRVMPGRTNSKFANSRNPYTIRFKNGAPVDKAGNKIPSSTGQGQNKSPDLHVPLTDFKF